MEKEKAIKKEKEFDKKYLFFNCSCDGSNQGTYKNWDVTFLLLTKEEKEKLIKKTYERMKSYNKNYKPKSWAGYSDNSGEDA